MDAEFPGNGIRGNFRVPVPGWSIMAGRFRETAPMPKKPTAKRRSARNTLRLPDLDHSKENHDIQTDGMLPFSQ
jgi:hypothetical protein